MAETASSPYTIRNICIKAASESRHSTKRIRFARVWPLAPHTYTMATLCPRTPAAGRSADCHVRGRDWVRPVVSYRWRRVGDLETRCIGIDCWYDVGSTRQLCNGQGMEITATWSRRCASTCATKRRDAMQRCYVNNLRGIVHYSYFLIVTYR